MRGSYKLIEKNSLKRDLKRIARKYRDISEILQAIDALEYSAYPDGWRKIVNLPKGKEALRVSVGDYRIIYSVNDKDKIVEVIHVFHRDETTYKNLIKRL